MLAAIIITVDAKIELCINHS